MNTTIDALKALYVQMGGSLETVADVTIIPDMIAALTAIATPFLTEADNGKVVVDGALVAQTAHADVTENGTIDTTTNNSVKVNVAGGASVEVASGTGGDIVLANTDVQTPPQVVTTGDLTRLTVIFGNGDFEFSYEDSDPVTVTVNTGVFVVPSLTSVDVYVSEEGPNVVYSYDSEADKFYLDYSDTTTGVTFVSASPTTFTAKLYQFEL